MNDIKSVLRLRKNVSGLKTVIVLLILFMIIQLTSCSVATEFSIEGKWKSVGEEGFGQAQPGVIVVFNGQNCNFLSPKDTYGFTKEDDGTYRLDVTSWLFSAPMSFDVEVVDNDHIIITGTSKTTELERVG